MEKNGTETFGDAALDDPPPDEKPVLEGATLVAVTVADTACAMTEGTDVACAICV